MKNLSREQTELSGDQLINQQVDIWSADAKMKSMTNEGQPLLVTIDGPSDTAVSLKTLL